MKTTVNRFPQIAVRQFSASSTTRGFLLPTIAFFLGAAAFSANAASITLHATVRDFKDGSKTGGHPDFEMYSGPLTAGLVGNTLGSDGKPIFTGTPGGKITSADTFAQWYNTVPSVNLETTIPLTLSDDASPGIYTYSNDSFFPIDGQLFGNENRSHNYHFTLELHTTFTYVAGQNFTFKGDDDLWVYINNQKVIDLGGVHQAATGSVNLDTLGLTPGNTYDFALFFAERHTSLSTFNIQTNIPLNPNPVPEPTAAALVIGAGAIGLFSRRRSRR